MLGLMKYTLIHQKKVLDKMILKLPEDKLEFRPKSEMRTPIELYHHIFQMALAYGLAVKEGVGKAEHLQVIPFDIDSSKNHPDLIKYGDEVSKLVLSSVESLSANDLNKEIIYTQWGDLKIDGSASLGTISDEMGHHRGQLSVYLRLLDIEPPFLYDFS